MNQVNRRFLFDFLVLFLVVNLTIVSYSSLPIPAQKSSSLTTEMRGVWLTNVASGVLFAPWGINRALDQLAALKFNTIYPVVWNRGFTFYKSHLAHQVTGSQTQPLLNFMHGGKDVLSELIYLARKKGLSVIPWFEYGLMTPADSQLAKRYPDWITWGQYGVTSLKEISPEETNHANLIQRYWLNPLHPQVQDFIQGLIVEVVSNYDIDGIQLDDHFGMPVLFGYDPFTIQLYQQEHQGKNPSIDPFDLEWMQWRTHKITNFMAKIHHAVKAIKPNIKISLSPNSPTFAYKYYLQDWVSWIKKGLIDELILQVYRDDQNTFISDLENPIVTWASTKIPVSIGISTGTMRHPVGITQIQAQVQSVRDRHFAGVAFFYWESLWGYIAPESPRKRRQAFQEMFNDQAKVIVP